MLWFLWGLVLGQESGRRTEPTQAPRAPYTPAALQAAMTQEYRRDPASAIAQTGVRLLITGGLLVLARRVFEKVFATMPDPTSVFVPSGYGANKMVEASDLLAAFVGSAMHVVGWAAIVAAAAAFVVAAIVALRCRRLGEIEEILDWYGHEPDPEGWRS
jgi:hypothetical protein